MTAKAKNKIAVDAARAEADDLLNVLGTPKKIQAYVSGLCQRFTSAPRVTILEQAVQLVAAGRMEIEKDALELLVRTNVADQKAVGLDKVILELAKLCATARVAEGRAWAIAVALIEMSLSENAAPYTSVCSQIGEKIRGEKGVSAACLRVIGSDDLTLSTMELWTALVHPALGDLSRRLSLSEDEVSEIVEELSGLSVEACPDSLILILPLLLENADDDRRRKFLGGVLGKRLQKNVLRSSPRDDAADEFAESSLLNSDERELIARIEATLIDAHKNAERLAEEAETRRAKSDAEWRDRLRDSESENSRLANRLEKSEADLQRLSEELESCRRQLKDKEDELGRHASEIKQITREKEHGHSDQQERYLTDLQSKLVEPAAKVRDLIVSHSEGSEESAREIRALAVAFDSLHKRLLKLAQTEDKRIPREILAGSKTDSR